MDSLTRQKRRITIKDVARQSGVSTQTVSRVLNERPDVSAETRKRVQAVIERLGYHPSALARSLIQQRSYTLGVIIAGLKYVGVSQTLNGIADQAEAEGYSLLLKELPRFDLEDVQPVIRSLLERDVEGIIYAAPQRQGSHRAIQEKLTDPCPPIVFLKGEAGEDYPSISIDNYSGACKAVCHLLEQGRRRIAHIAGPLEWWESEQRLLGWRDTLQGAGLACESEQWRCGNWSSASGEKAFLDLQESYPEMDAVFAANDQMALGLLHAAHISGIRVPEQLAVVGFDDLAEAAYYSPALTSVRQDLRSLGTLAVRKVLQLACSGSRPEDEDFLPDQILLDPELIVRDSSAVAIEK
jgi:LacI family transcriptional regulator